MENIRSSLEKILPTINIPIMKEEELQQQQQNQKENFRQSFQERFF